MQRNDGIALLFSQRTLIQCNQFNRGDIMKGSFVGGCIVGLIIGIIICCVGVGIFSFVFYQRTARVHRTEAHGFSVRSEMSAMSITQILGTYELADADAVKRFNARVKKWFAERGYEELKDIPLRSIERKTSGNFKFMQTQGEWNKPGVLLFKKFDDRNSIHILVPDCYDYGGERYVQAIGCRSDFDGQKDYVIELDRLLDDFERTFPAGNYKGGLPDDIQ